MRTVVYVGSQDGMDPPPLGEEHAPHSLNDSILPDGNKRKRVGVSLRRLYGAVGAVLRDVLGGNAGGKVFTSYSATYPSRKEDLDPGPQNKV